jgi:hypothetical protein
LSDKARNLNWFAGFSLPFLPMLSSCTEIITVTDQADMNTFFVDRMIKSL